MILTNKNNKIIDEDKEDSKETILESNSSSIDIILDDEDTVCHYSGLLSTEYYK